MSELRSVSSLFKQSHAAKIRRVANRMQKADSECIEVAIYLHDLADKIDDAFARGVVVDFSRRGHGPKDAA